MKEIMYDQPTLLIAAILFMSMLVAIELGYRLGTGRDPQEMSKAQIIAMQGSLLGVLALLLGFTFSLSLQRFDSRSAAVIDESNAIGTAWLRAQLLVEPARGQAMDTLQSYTDMRVRSATVSLDQHGRREALQAEATALHERLWLGARSAVASDDRMITSGLYVQSLNDLIDAYGLRDAALNRHVPEVVLFLLYFTFLITGGILGYASGVSAHRPSSVAYLMVGLIVLLVFIIIDLDRPRRGMIEVSHSSLRDLQTSMQRSKTRSALERQGTVADLESGAAGQ